MNLPNKNCTGCSACYSVCPKQAISIEQDREGFYKPIIDNNKCVDCGLCNKICPIEENHSDRLLYKPSERAFAVKSKSKELQLQCTSGGFFTTLAKAWIHAGGVVYGAAYDEKYSVHHIRVERMEEIGRLSDSKYAQSKIDETFILAKKDLQMGKSVLFSGTACQIAGIRSFLGKDYDNLFCIDVICHGVPSPAVWNYYIEEFQREKGKVVHVRHKGKYEGGWSWQKQFFEAQVEDGTVFRENIWENAYMRGFLKDIYLNNACHDCKFKNSEVRRISDLTIADYWGCENEEKDFFDPNGVSLVIVNSPKGQEILERSNAIFEIKKTCLEKALNYNVAALRPYRKPYVRAYFYEKWRKEETLEAFNTLIEKCEAKLDIEKKTIHYLSRFRAIFKKILRR